jgi:hypothetical protein
MRKLLIGGKRRLNLQERLKRKKCLQRVLMCS